MNCSHPWNKRRPTKVVGLTHCGECHTDFSCGHPPELHSEADIIIYCTGCDEIVGASQSTLVSYPRPAIVMPNSQYPVH